MNSNLREDQGTKVLVKAFRILSQFDSAHRTFTASQLAEVTGINRTTAYRLLTTLVQEGYLCVPQPGQYTLGPKLIGLGHVASQTFRVEWAIQPVVTALRDDTQETATFYIRDDVNRRVIAEATSPHPIRYMDGLGTRFPLVAGAAGRAILSLLADSEVQQLIARVPRYRPSTETDPKKIWSLISDVRRTGIAFSCEEYTEGAVSVATPVYDPQRALIGSLSVTLPIGRFSEALLPELRAKVLSASNDLHQRLGVMAPKYVQDARL